MNKIFKKKNKYVQEKGPQNLLGGSKKRSHLYLILLKGLFDGF